MFVLDGYDSQDPDFFWFNFGWGIGTDYNLSRQYLGDLTPGEYSFNWNHMIITGFSPTYDFDINLTDIPYSSVSGKVLQTSLQTTIIPATNKTLSITNGGELDLTAGQMIKLEPGFSAKTGCNFKAQIDASITGDNMDIPDPNWKEWFTPNGDGINDNLCIDVQNADSWEFCAFDRNSNPVYQSAGSIVGGTACMWDGSGTTGTDAYLCFIRFKNNFGRAKEKDYMVTVIRGLKSGLADTGIIISGQPEDELLSKTQTITSNSDVIIYPSINNGSFFVKFPDKIANDITIYNSLGQIILKKDKITSNIEQIEVKGSHSGVYIVQIRFDNKVSINKIIINK
jgi:hypothetical protein